MMRQLPREASRQPQGQVKRTLVDDERQEREDERDELKRALEQSMFEELHRQKLEAERKSEEIKRQAEELQRQRDETALRNERLVEELLKRKDVEPPRTPPRRPRFYSISSPQLRATPGGTQVPPGKPPPEPMDFSEF